MPQHRTYQLFIDVVHTVTVAVGALGVFSLRAGRYVYTGSAKRNLEARVRRHLARDKRLHWHIDYLLAAHGVSVAEVRRYTIEECEINRRTAGTLPVPGFGASDCRAHCGGHLKYLGRTVCPIRSGPSDQDAAPF